MFFSFPSKYYLGPHAILYFKYGEDELLLKMINWLYLPIHHFKNGFYNLTFCNAQQLHSSFLLFICFSAVDSYTPL